MILVDTSAWVEYDRATGSNIDLRLTELIGGGSDIAATEPILMEILAGARTPDAATQLRRLLTSFTWIPSDAQIDFEAAAKVYRECRVKGITPRGLIDCMISSIAIRTNSELLTADADFSAIATVIPLRLAKT